MTPRLNLWRERGATVLAKQQARPTTSTLPSNHAVLYVDTRTGRLRVIEAQHGDRAVEAGAGTVGPHTHAQSDITGLVADLAARPTLAVTRNIVAMGAHL